MTDNNSCFNCHVYLGKNCSLLKLKDNNYYCYRCIRQVKVIRDLIEEGSYWFYILRLDKKEKTKRYNYGKS